MYICTYVNVSLFSAVLQVGLQRVVSNMFFFSSSSSFLYKPAAKFATFPRSNDFERLSLK